MEERRREGQRRDIHSERKRARNRRKRRARRARRLAFAVCLCLIFLVGGNVRRRFASGGLEGAWKGMAREMPVDGFREMGDASVPAGSLGGEGGAADAGSGEGDADGCPQVLQELLEKNEETKEFVESYPDREQYMGREIDLSAECAAGGVPLLMQWDLRWGYDSYGKEMIGVEGCGPTCMTMAYLYLKGDASMNPREMAKYAYENGYYSEEGTSWSFFTEGADGLGLTGYELPLSEEAMERELDGGSVIVCSMRPGDFTTTGHFILLRGYDGNGFYVNDPNSRKNSGRQWDFETLKPQIKCLWRIG